MQPPPRKVKWTVALKNIHAEQFSKLQQKHQQDVELLDDIRCFSKQRSIIEKEYAQALGKLVQQYLSKRPTSTSRDTDNGDQNNRTVQSVWRTLLEQSDRVMKARLTAAETYAQEISEPLKAVKAIKCQVAKKVFEQLLTLQKEAAQTVAELSKSHKTYSDDEHVAHDARVKATEAASKVQNKSTNLFTSFATLQKNSAKLSTRKELSEARATAARNEYLLNLAASNAHQRRYYSTDLPKLIESLDGEMYEKVREFYSVSANTELECCGVSQECFARLQMDASQVNREYNVECFLRQNTIVTNQLQYAFEAQDNDKVRRMCRTADDDQSLEKEARKWATRIARETRAVQDNLRQLQLLQAAGGGGGKVDSKSSDSTSPSSSVATSPVDPEVKMEEIRQTVRRLETGREKAEARIEVLRDAGVNVDAWLASTAAEIITSQHQEDVRSDHSSSSVSLRTDPSEGRSRVESAAGAEDGDQRTSAGDRTALPTADTTYINYDDEDFVDETFTGGMDDDGGAGAGAGQDGAAFWGGRSQPTKCVSLYDFSASNVDELSLKENECLELVGDGEGDGWVKARNGKGAVGFIPENYIQVSDDPSTDDNEMFVDGPPSVSPPESTTSPGGQSQSYSTTDYEVQQTVMAAQLPSDGVWVRAMYDYEATSVDELSFLEGQLLEVLSKDENGVDDGFWQGRVNGRVGVFPALVVEELDITDQIIVQELTSAPRSGTAPFSPDAPPTDPPHLQVTQPTPSPTAGTVTTAVTNHSDARGCRDRQRNYNDYYPTESTV